MGVVWNDVTTVQQTGSHVLAVTGITLDHLVVRLEARHCHLLDGVGFVGSLSSGDDWGVGDQREMDSGIRNQVGLEFVQVDVQGSIESQRGSNRRDDYMLLIHRQLLAPQL